MTGEPFRLVGDPSGHEYALGCTPGATEVQQAKVINRLQKLILDELLEPIIPGDTIRVEILDSNRSDDGEWVR